MSLELMVPCWGPLLPTSEPAVRLLALTIADGLGVDDQGRAEIPVDDPDYWRRLRERSGMTVSMLHWAWDALVALAVVRRDDGGVMLWQRPDRWYRDERPPLARGWPERGLGPRPS